MRPDLCPRVTLPELPEAAQTVARMASFSDPAVSYEVDLRDLSCSCPDYLARHCFVDEFDFGRLCKHLAVAIRNAVGLSPLEEAIVRDGRSRSYHRVPLGMRGEFILGVTPGYPWTDVFTETGGAWKRFGYSLVERRWSWHTEPPASAGVATIIQRLPIREYSERDP